MIICEATVSDIGSITQVTEAAFRDHLIQQLVYALSDRCCGGRQNQC